MIDREDIGGVIVLRMNHGKANAMDVELFEGIAETFEGLTGESGAVVLTGTGSMFSAGVDLYRLLAEDEGYTSGLVDALHRSLVQVFTFPRPVVAAVNGHAIAGGCIFAAACDYRLMADGKGRIGVPELLVGVPFPPSALEILRFAMAHHRIEEVVYTGRTYLPDEAREAGLVDRVVPADELLDEAIRLAGAMGAVPSRSFALTKQEIRQPTVERIERRHAVVGSDMNAVWGSDEVRSAIQAYMDEVAARKR